MDLAIHLAFTLYLSLREGFLSFNLFMDTVSLMSFIKGIRSITLLY